jgi:hypothetical protein
MAATLRADRLSRMAATRAVSSSSDRSRKRAKPPAPPRTAASATTSSAVVTFSSRSLARSPWSRCGMRLSGAPKSFSMSPSCLRR